MEARQAKALHIAVTTSLAPDNGRWKGPSRSGTGTYTATKHGRVIESRDWRKAHVMCGTSTHLVTAVKVTDSNANEAPHLLPLAESTGQRFTMDEISADKGYLTKRNAVGIEDLGATPFIPFKSNSVEPPAGSAWARMYPVQLEPRRVREALPQAVERRDGLPHDQGQVR